MKKQIFIAAICSAVMLSSCSKNGEPDVSETTAEAADEVTVEASAQTTETTSITEESTSVSTESVSETAADIVNNNFNLYEPEVKVGAPEVCDLDAIKARRRTDMAENYTAEGEYIPEYWHFDEYPDPADFVEKHFGYSFDDSDPVTSYVEDDFDLDGNSEYYLCMAEYVVKQLEWENERNEYEFAAVTSVYYIDDDGTAMNVFSSLLKMEMPEAIFGDSAEGALNDYLNSFNSENTLKFQISRGYGNLLAPVVIDNGDSRHLFWKNDNSYPADYGAYIFWGDKSIRVEISSPSASLGGFYEWDGTSEEIFRNEREKFGEDFWATTVNLASKLDLYTYPEINGKVNTLKWDGQNYVYNIINQNNGSSLESGPIEWK